MPLCFATNNLHKLKEVKASLQGAFSLLTLKDIGCEEELPETQDTIVGNAQQKARYVWEHYGIPCFADDSGLEVEALNGAPGVISAMYAGSQRSHDDNIRLLLKNLDGHENRAAQFRTVIALVLPQGEWIFEGILKGEILLERRGSGGFGYDPIFLPIGFSRSLAELTMEEKNRISHRWQAVQKLSTFLQSNPSFISSTQ